MTNPTQVDDLHPENLRKGSLHVDAEVKHPNIKEPVSPRGTHTPKDTCPVDDLHPKNLREGVHHHVDKDE